MDLYLKEDINDNIDYLTNVFEGFGDIVKRKITIGYDKKQSIFLCYLDMMIDRELIDDKILRPLQSMEISDGLYTHTHIIDFFTNLGLHTLDISITNEYKKVIDAVLCGDTPLLLDGTDKAIIISTKGFMSRGVPECSTEVVVTGSKEAFSEVFRINTMLLRRRIRDTNLKMEQLKVGKISKTDVAVVYMDNLVRKPILEEVLKRISDINVDAILDSSYIEQYIEDSTLSPFPTVQLTERPDKASSALLEGRICIIVDNSPFVLLVPATLNVFFQASEDYYERFEIMSFVRSIRFLSAFLTIAIEGLFLCVSLYHPSMIPLDLALKMSSERQFVPFPELFELLFMEFSFELLREGGIRLPSPIGGTIGIVGGLIIGQSAVSAGLVSPIVIIIVAFSAVCSFSIPNNGLVSAFRLSKYFVLFSCAFLGFFGFCMSMIVLAIHLCSLDSFSIPYLYPFVSGEINNYSDFKDTIFRSPLGKMTTRPIFTTPENEKRGGKNDRK